MTKEKEPCRKWQRDTSLDAKGKIIKALLDGKAHQYGELLKITKLSKATLSLHLKKMVEKEEVIRGMNTYEKYPYPVSYMLKQSWPLIDSLIKDISATLKKADDDFRETLDPTGFFYYMNSYLNLMMLWLIPLIRDMEKALSEKENAEKIKQLRNLKELPFEPLEEYTDIMASLFADTAKIFAKDFFDMVLKYCEKLDFNELEEKLRERIKKQSAEFCYKEDAEKQAEETGQRKSDLERIAKLKAKPQRYDPELVKEVKEYLKNIEELKEKEAKKDDKHE
jgi:DNA-binding HxlR family transcriptional regulator